MKLVSMREYASGLSEVEYSSHSFDKSQLCSVVTALIGSRGSIGMETLAAFSARKSSAKRTSASLDSSSKMELYADNIKVVEKSSEHLSRKTRNERNTAQTSPLIEYLHSFG